MSFKLNYLFISKFHIKHTKPKHKQVDDMADCCIFTSRIYHVTWTGYLILLLIIHCILILYIDIDYTLYTTV